MNDYDLWKRELKLPRGNDAELCIIHLQSLLEGTVTTELSQFMYFACFHATNVSADLASQVAGMKEAPIFRRVECLDALIILSLRSLALTEMIDLDLLQELILASNVEAELGQYTRAKQINLIESATMHPKIWTLKKAELRRALKDIIARENLSSNSKATQRGAFLDEVRRVRDQVERSMRIESDQIRDSYLASGGSYS